LRYASRRDRLSASQKAQQGNFSQQEILRLAQRSPLKAESGAGGSSDYLGASCGQK
jgi:hypothetical protein